MTHIFSDNGRKYDVNQLIRLAARLKSRPIPISDIMGVSRSRRNGFSPVTRLPYADPKFPVMLGPDNMLVDGQHRVAKRQDQGETTVDAVQLRPRHMEKALIKNAAPRTEKTADLKPGVELRPHQQDAVQSIQQSPDGVLLYHGLGSGKTLSSIAAAEAEHRPALAVVPAALRGNFRKELERFTTPGTAKNYDIQSYNALAGGKVKPKPTLIADEVQRLRNQDTGGYRGALEAASKADKRILLSGTPMVNGPGDLASLINLLHGKQLYTSEKFEDRFAGMDVRRPFPYIFRKPVITPVVRHEHELKRLLEGRVHYVGDEQESKPSVQENEINVPMSSLQSQMTRAMVNDLPFYLRWKFKRNLPPNRRDQTQLNAFLSGMRQVGLSPYGYDRRLDYYKAFQQSPKLQEVMKRTLQELKNPSGKVMHYSNFIENGLKPLSAALDKHKIPHSLFTGSMGDKQKRDAVEDYNAGRSRVVLVGPAGAEGISLKGTTRVGLLDPHWNEARINQARGRAVRLDSHTHLPIDLRNVAVDKYIAEPRRSLMRRITGQPAPVSSDTYLYARSAEKQKQLGAFLRVLKEVGQR